MMQLSDVHLLAKDIILAVIAVAIFAAIVMPVLYYLIKWAAWWFPV